MTCELCKAQYCSHMKDEYCTEVLDNEREAKETEEEKKTFFEENKESVTADADWVTKLEEKQAAKDAMDETDKPEYGPDGKKFFPLVGLPKTRPPFIVLERDTNRGDGKGVHVISLAEKKLLKLGRGHESDVRFADVSISRWHASVHYDAEKRSFTLTDHMSKFGTLVAMRAPVLVPSHRHLTLQSGRTVLQYHLREVGKVYPESIRQQLLQDVVPALHNSTAGPPAPGNNMTMQPMQTQQQKEQEQRIMEKVPVLNSGSLTAEQLKQLPDMSAAGQRAAGVPVPNPLAPAGGSGAGPSNPAAAVQPAQPIFPSGATAPGPHNPAGGVFGAIGGIFGRNSGGGGGGPNNGGGNTGAGGPNNRKLLVFWIANGLRSPFGLLRH